MSEKIKVGIVGLGRAGMNMHVREISMFPELFTIVAGADPTFSRAKHLEEKCGARPYKSIEELLQDPEVELVSVASRSADHLKHTLQALEAGKSVFLEKPIAVNYDEALQLAEADKKYPNKLYFRQNRRFEPGFVFVRELIDSGKIGEVFEIKLRRLSFQLRNDWQVLTECEGGQMNNWGPHLIDQALQLLDSPVKDIWCDRKRVAASGDAEDHFRLIMRSENGRVADIEISGGCSVPEPYFTVHGTRGTIVCKDDEELSYRWLPDDDSGKGDSASKENPAILPDEENTVGMGGVTKWRWGTIMIEPKQEAGTHLIWKYLYETIRNSKEFPIKTEEAVEVVRITDEAKKQSEIKHFSVNN